MATKTLYVGNLPYSTSESDLSNAFSAYGAQNARIVEGRGFGFVDIDDTQLDLAITAMNGKDMGGRTLNVNEARPRGEGSGGSYGSGSPRGDGGYSSSRKRSW
jgi:RNA recognition motif-containing protein